LSGWLEHGQDYETFWRLTPREVSAILRGNVARLRSESDVARHRNYELASLIAFAFHDPKEMPEFKAMSAPQQKARDDALNHARVRGYLMALAMQPQSS
jgi:hypothetical protein